MPKKPSEKKKKKILEEVKEDEEVAFVPRTDYTDAEEEFGVSITPQSDLHQVMKGFDDPDRIDANTVLNEEMATMILHIKVFERSYPGLGFDKFVLWFNTIRLAVDGGNVKRKVEVLKGNVTLQPNPESQQKRGF